MESELGADFCVFKPGRGSSREHEKTTLCPSSNTNYHAFPEQSGATATGGHVVPPAAFHTWNNQDFQHQITLDSPLNSVYQPASQNSNHFNPTFISSPVTFDSYNFPNTSATTEYDAALQHPDFICNLSGIGGSHNFILTSATASEMDSFASDDAQPDATASANLSAPITGTTTVASANANTNRLTCNHIGCPTTFARAGDRRRHIKMHPPQHPCLVNNCGRNGDKAFYRLDQLRDHQRKKHGMAV